MLRLVDGTLQAVRDLFLTEFSCEQKRFSSTLRELLGMLWWVRATRDRTKHRLVFICDNLQSCRAVLRGSRVAAIQLVAEEIFLWCLENNKVCWPIWVPRTHVLIQEADRRSRLRIPHDERSPVAVVSAANVGSEQPGDSHVGCRALLRSGGLTLDGSHSERCHPAV